MPLSYLPLDSYVDGLLNFFMHRVLVAVGAKLFQLDAAGSITTIFLSGIPRNPVRPLIGVGATLGALKGNYQTNAFSHDKLDQP